MEKTFWGARWSLMKPDLNRKAEDAGAVVAEAGEAVEVAGEIVEAAAEVTVAVAAIGRSATKEKE